MHDILFTLQLYCLYLVNRTKDRFAFLAIWKGTIEMKHLKRVLSITLAGCLAACTFLVGVGATDATSVQTNKDSIAYLELESVPQAMWDSILQARRTIIYGGQAWTVNGATQIVHADGTTEMLPEFKDLYPGWEVPPSSFVQATVACVSSVRTNHCEGNVHLKLANNLLDTPAFYAFTSTGEPLNAYAKTLPGDRCNIGFTNEYTFQDEGWTPNLAKGDKHQLKNPQAGVRYSARASVHTSNEVGWARMVVEPA